jgi:hypothetical protein
VSTVPSLAALESCCPRRSRPKWDVLEHEVGSEMHFKTTAAYKRASLKESEANWIKADLVLQDIPTRGSGGDHTSKTADSPHLLAEQIVDYAKAVGEEPGRITYERKMAAAWPRSKRRKAATWGAVV